MEKQTYLTVSALNKYIKYKFDHDPHLKLIYVRGEISNCKIHKSGHLYCTLKDKEAVVRAVMFSGDFRKVTAEIKNGVNVLVVGYVSVYEKAGDFQIYMKELVIDGQGNLFLELEKMKERLGSEGLFALEWKKKLPTYPQKIAIITSQDGAALHDMLTTIRRRYPIVHILIIPATVQGSQAADSIVESINRANERTDIDLILLGRGGGSIEDLWGFNEEKVARAIFASQIPIITAIGHETDTTIADYVADFRAPTPTGAAEIATPNQSELRSNIRNFMNKLEQKLQIVITNKREQLNVYNNAYAFKRPEEKLHIQLQHIMQFSERMEKAFASKILQSRKDFNLVNLMLKRSTPYIVITAEKKQLREYNNSLNKLIKFTIESKKALFFTRNELLQAIDPLKFLQKGYGLLSDEANNIIKSIDNIKIDQTLIVQVSDGQLVCQVKTIKEKNNVK